MKLMKKALFIPIFLLITFFSQAQEFICQVQVTSPQVEGTDKKVFQTLQQAIYDFINNRKWSNYNFKPEERIECSMMINIDSRSVSSDQFSGKMTLILKRPVYKTSYNTTLLNYIDNDFKFTYVEYQPLDYADNSYSSNLTALLAYYVYVMLGYDADSFSPFGGTPYFEKAKSIVNLAQSQAKQTETKGWQGFESTRNRFWLVENLMNSSYSSYREGIYQYHRLGLDQMSENVEIGRSAINDCLENVRKAYRERPNLYIVQLFVDAKRDELVNVYSQAAQLDKSNAVNILKEIDPANSSKYQQIMRQDNSSGGASGGGLPSTPGSRK